MLIFPGWFIEVYFDIPKFALKLFMAYVHRCPRVSMRNMNALAALKMSLPVYWFQKLLRMHVVHHITQIWISTCLSGQIFIVCKVNGVKPIPWLHFHKFFGTLLSIIKPRVLQFALQFLQFASISELKVFTLGVLTQRPLCFFCIACVHEGRIHPYFLDQLAISTCRAKTHRRFIKFFWFWVFLNYQRP
jgi:hypothetical protein